MCKYCDEGNENPIIESNFKGHGATVKLWKNGNLDLMQWFTEPNQAGDLKRITDGMSQRIKFCPFCGRNLENHWYK